MHDDVYPNFTAISQSVTHSDLINTLFRSLSLSFCLSSMLVLSYFLMMTRWLVQPKRVKSISTWTPPPPPPLPRTALTAQRLTVLSGGSYRRWWVTRRCCRPPPQPISTNGVDDLRFLFQTSQVTATTAGRYMITLPLRQSHYSTSHHVTSPHPLILPRLHFYDVTITS